MNWNNRYKPYETKPYLSVAWHEGMELTVYRSLDTGLWGYTIRTFDGLYDRFPCYESMDIAKIYCEEMLRKLENV